MGFASKWEDEVERRGGAAGTPVVRRMENALAALGGGTASQRLNELPFDEEAEKRLKAILLKLEQLNLNRLKAITNKSSRKWAGKFVSAHGKFAQAIDELVIFLVPYVRCMKGENRRSWSRTIERIKRVRYIA